MQDSTTQISPDEALRRYRNTISLLAEMVADLGPAHQLTEEEQIQRDIILTLDQAVQ